jgi:mannose-1-phosphate guanylyltransferase/phosphomannomutase
VRESYASDLLATLDANTIASRRFRIVVDYGHSAASFVLPLVLGPLEVEAVSAHEFADLDAREPTGPESIAQGRRLVEAVGADLGAVFDLASERVHLIAEDGEVIEPAQALLLFLCLLRGSEEAGGKVALPVTATAHADELAEAAGLAVVRTPTGPSDLMQAARESGMVLAADGDGAYVIPDFQPAFDAMAALCKLLELLAPLTTPVSELVATLPDVNISKHTVPCPWALKGLVMRVLTERLVDREVDLSDGIKVFENGGWGLVRPDPVEPLLHVVVESSDGTAENPLEQELLTLVEEALAEEPISSRG